MARRFGRNQKRRAREALERAEEVALKLERSEWQAQRLAKNAIAQEQAAKQVLCEFIEALPEHSIYAPATLAKHLGRIDPKARQFQVCPPLEFSFEDMDSPTAVAVTTQTLHRLHILADRSSFKEQMHMEVRLTDGSAGYAVSEAALRALSPEKFERVIARQLARAFIPALTKQGFLKGR